MYYNVIYGYIWYYNVLYGYIMYYNVIFNKLDLSAMSVNDKEMLLVISRLMRSSHWILKGIAFDAHHSHRFLRDVLLGAFELCSREMISDIEWFKDLDFLPLPPHELPRLPLQICMDHGEPFWCLSGACGLVLKAEVEFEGFMPSKSLYKIRIPISILHLITIKSETFGSP